MSRHEAQQWVEEQQAIADKWFDGDTQKAMDVLDALPYSTIPEWFHVDDVMKAIHHDSPERELADRFTREDHQ